MEIVSAAKEIQYRVGCRLNRSEARNLSEKAGIVRIVQ